MAIAPGIDLSPAQLEQVRSLLHQHLPGIPVWAYGSRVKSTARPHSDLDLALFSRPDQSLNVAALREAFDESNLPFRVDCFVWNDIPESFRQNIQSHHIAIQ